MRRGMALALLGALILFIPGTPPPAFAQGLGANEVKAYKERTAAFFQKDRFGEALAVAEKWAKAAEKAEGKKPGAGTAEALGNTAWCATLAKKPGRALAASERALKLAPDMLWIETNHAHALLFLGRTQEAIAAYIARKGETIPDYGKWEEVILKDFAELRKRGLNHRDMARVTKALAKAPLSALAQAREDIAALNQQLDRLVGQNNYKEASALAEKALSLAERALGKEHPDTLASVNTLALAYQIQGRLAEAEPLLKRALDVRERVLGKDHADTLESANGLASLYQAQGRLTEAGPLYQRVLEARERVLGKDHADTLTSLVV
jgi:tetratricopeptide (TPR) repeat protein